MSQTMTQAEADREAFRLAQAFLLGFGDRGVTSAVLAKYSNMSSLTPKPTDIAGIYLRLLESAQNANMKSTVIGKSIGGVSSLAPVLHQFNPVAVIEQYGEDDNRLLNDIVKQLHPRGQVLRNQRSIWPKFCKSILSAARFLSQFPTAADFFSWIDLFSRDARARPALPMAISMEIEGIGFPLACDFLKEMGYTEFAKPDVHLKHIFKGLHLCPASADDYQVFKAVVRLASNAGVTPYAADKIFWLIGSGNFHNDPKIGKIGQNRDEFVKQAGPQLRKMGWQV